MKGHKHRRHAARELGEHIHDIAEDMTRRRWRLGEDYCRMYLENFAEVAAEMASTLKEQAMLTYLYRYTDEKTGLPLKKCPVCQHDLTADDGVEIVLYDEGRGNWDEDSALEKDGTLFDPHGHVAQGLHSTTKCGGCGIQLHSVAHEECLTKEPIT